MIGKSLSHYKITDSLGSGGMGDVYLAEDSKLERMVALKVLPAALAADRDRLDRFRREAKTVASLNHPNIVTIYSVESVPADRAEDSDTHFLTMEHVAGKAIDQLMPRGGFAFARMLEIGTQITDALEAAHNRGITHRDLKPANVMVTDEGRVKVLDFGLAKPGDGGTGEETELLTQDGLVLGTVPYMSPEQVQGKPVDHRSDIFSFGILLYEMATGRRPFKGDNTASLISSILRDEPRDITTVRAALPHHLNRVVGRCLEKQPEKRYQRIGDVRFEFDSLREDTSSGAIVLAAELEADRRDQHSIAVLPFKNMSPDPDNEFFADGVTEEIMNILSDFDGLRVAARTSCFAFKGKSPNVAEVGELLRVGTVLEGSVRRAGNRLRISAQLVNSDNGYQLWSERYDRELDDVFALQDEIAATIARKLELTMSGEEEKPRRRGTDNLEALDLYLKGRFHWEQRGAGLAKGLEFFEKALDADPHYVLAHTGVADAYSMFGFYGVAPAAHVVPKAKEAAQKALSLDETSAEAHTAYAAACLQDWDFDTAEREFLRAIELDPRYPPARYWYGGHYLAMARDRLDDGIRHCRRAVELDPLSSFSVAILSLMYYIANRPEDALPLLEGALARDPQSALINRAQGLVLQSAGRLEEAYHYLEQTMELTARSPWSMMEMGTLLVDLGRRDEAVALQAELEERSKGEAYMSPFALSEIPIALGELDRAFDYLEKAYEVRDPLLYVVGSWPVMRKYHGEPRFQALLEKVGLA